MLKKSIEKNSNVGVREIYIFFINKQNMNCNNKIEKN